MIRSVPARAVVDTNIVVSALLARRGVPAAIIDALLRDRFRLVLSAELMAEYAEVLSRPYLVRRLKVSAIEIEASLRQLGRHADFVHLPLILPVSVRDAKDVKVVATAIGGAADFLVSGDMDLLSLVGDPRLVKLQIVTPREFMMRFQE